MSVDQLWNKSTSTNSSVDQPPRGPPRAIGGFEAALIAEIRRHKYQKNSQPVTPGVEVTNSSQLLQFEATTPRGILRSSGSTSRNASVVGSERHQPQLTLSDVVSFLGDANESEENSHDGASIPHENDGEYRSNDEQCGSVPRVPLPQEGSGSRGDRTIRQSSQFSLTTFVIGYLEATWGSTESAMRNLSSVGADALPRTYSKDDPVLVHPSAKVAVVEHGRRSYGSYSAPESENQEDVNLNADDIGILMKGDEEVDREPSAMFTSMRQLIAVSGRDDFDEQRKSTYASSTDQDGTRDPRVHRKPKKSKIKITSDFSRGSNDGRKVTGLRISPSLSPRQSLSPGDHSAGVSPRMAMTRPQSARKSMFKVLVDRRRSRALSQNLENSDSVDPDESMLKMFSGSDEQVDKSRSRHKLDVATDEQYGKEGHLTRMRRVQTVMSDVMLLFLILTAFLVSYRVGAPGGTMHDVIAIVELVVDLLVLLMHGLNFVMPYSESGGTVSDFYSTIRWYMRSDLRWHVVALFPLQIPFAAAGMTLQSRWARINRLLLLVDFQKHFRVFVDSHFSNIHPTPIRIVVFVMFIILSTTLLTGFFLFFLRMETHSDVENWFDYSVPTMTDHVFFFELGWFTSLRCVAGRDMPYPVTDIQTACALCMIMFGTAASSTIIAGVTEMIITLVEHASQLQRKLDDTNHELERLRLPESYQEEVRSYYKHMWSITRDFNYQSADEIFGELPGDLLDEIIYVSNVVTISSIPLFTQVSEDFGFVRDLAVSLEYTLFLPGAVIVHEGDEGDEMFFLQTGEAEVIKSGAGVVFFLHSGSFFGEVTMIFGGLRSATIRAIAMCQCYSLHRTAFHELVEDHPTALNGILEAATKSASQKPKEDDNAAAPAENKDDQPSRKVSRGEAFESLKEQMKMSFVATQSMSANALRALDGSVSSVESAKRCSMSQWTIGTNNEDNASVASSSQSIFAGPRLAEQWEMHMAQPHEDMFRNKSARKSVDVAQRALTDLRRCCLDVTEVENAFTGSRSSSGMPNSANPLRRRSFKDSRDDD